MSPAFRRAAAIVLAAAALLILAARAWESVAPLPVSLAVMRKFWRAGTPTRLLNSRLFRRDTELGAALVSGDRFLPLEADVVLTVPVDLADGPAEEMRRKAAFVLAPRRVTLARGESGRDGFALAAAPPGKATP
jgi:GNAT superfamily N-acetyltransferase